MKIAIFTHASIGYWPVAELGNPNKLEYAMRHGYGFQFHRIDSLNEITYRCSVISSALSQVDWLLFMGADTLITNMTIKLESLIDCSVDWVYCVDINGLNNDVQLLRNTPATHEFLCHTNSLLDKGAIDNQKAQWAAKDLANGFRFKGTTQKFMNSYCTEQCDIWNLHDPQYRWSKGDFVVHFAGVRNERRVRLMKSHLQEVVR